MKRTLLLISLFVVVAWIALREWEASFDPPNYAQVDEYLFIGGNVEKPPRGTEAVLNLCEAEDPYSATVHRWEPIRDAAPAPDLEWLRTMVKFVDEQQKAKRRTYVHCMQGVSRSATVVIAWLMFHHGWTRDEALAFLREKRPIVRPNSAFMERLMEWERALK